ncbi:IS21 family transposase [Desulfosediminicola flagellatus]|uniref:IS21 family transposase n=1 Tax=Desulfosediminicola flagellatus TaxID=2569541 RepID=UPI0010AC217D|nr:IS21 family transposase [Desulfosediminicola flagellatus]
MVTDFQVRKLKKYLSQGKTLEVASLKAGMDEKTGRKYRDLEKLPSEINAERIRDWRTRDDPFDDVWSSVTPFLESNDALEAKTLFCHLQRLHPGRFSDGQLRTFQRRVKNWRATAGPGNEIYFPQKHHPGRLGQSDFTHMDKLQITIAGQPFDHLVFHFVLTYSNWETGTICFSESFESLSEGLQQCLWQLGGAPEQHQTDRLSAAVNKPENLEEFTRAYQGLLDHYNMQGRKTNPSSPHENGDIEQRHYRFKKAVDQALMLRGSRDFTTRQEYELFLQKLFAQLNRNRQSRFLEEQAALKPLPSSKLDTCTRFEVRVGPSSTIRIKHKVYSVNSRLIKEKVNVRLYSGHLEIWYGQSHIENIPRIRGSNKHYIQYRHIIDWLVRKPRAFENYRYLNDLFPTSRFRMAYDTLAQQHCVTNAAKEYLSILQLAAQKNETAVDDALRYLIAEEEPINATEVHKFLSLKQPAEPVTDVSVQTVTLAGYDQLLEEVHG